MAGSTGRRGWKNDREFVWKEGCGTKAMKIFLSYASQDRETAAPIARGLREAGHDVYPSVHWPADVAAALKRAEAFVVVLSPAAVGSPFVTQEIEGALQSEHLENRVIPVVVQLFTQVPWILQTMDPIASTGKPELVAKAVNKRLVQSVASATR